MVLIPLCNLFLRVQTLKSLFLVDSRLQIHCHEAKIVTSLP